MFRSTILAILLTLTLGYAVVADPTASIESQSTQNLGTVTVATSTSTEDISIPAAGTYNISIGGSLASVTIAGQQIAYPNTGTVSLPNGHEVEVSWPSTNLIVVMDLITGNRPSLE